jgi:hypothetical protein
MSTLLASKAAGRLRADSFGVLGCWLSAIGGLDEKIAMP